MGVIDRVKRAWNAFMNKDPTRKSEIGLGTSSSYNPYYRKSYSYYDKSLAKYILNRMAVDFSSVRFKHVLTDDEDNYIGDVVSPLNYCFNINPNIDQGPSDFLRDYASTLLDNGLCALVPIDTDVDPEKNESFEVYSMRIATVLQFYPKHVKVRAWNDKTGDYEEVIVSKTACAIMENPFYSIMNEPNSILFKINRKFKVMDYIDDEMTSGKLNIIIQLPYIAKNELMQERAESRVKRLEAQLKDNPYGIAYTDSTEKIVQLNKQIESNYLSQIEYLTKTFMDQLGVTPEILNGTADDKVLTNYYNRIIEPLAATLAENVKRKWLSTEEIAANESIMYFRDSFKLVPVTLIGELGDSLIRNRVLTPNDFRAKLGLKPSDDPSANTLMNPNMPIQDQYENIPVGDAYIDEGGNYDGQV